MSTFNWIEIKNITTSKDIYILQKYGRVTIRHFRKYLKYNPLVHIEKIDDFICRVSIIEEIPYYTNLKHIYRLDSVGRVIIPFFKHAASKSLVHIKKIDDLICEVTLINKDCSYEKFN